MVISKINNLNNRKNHITTQSNYIKTLKNKKDRTIRKNCNKDKY